MRTVAIMVLSGSSAIAMTAKTVRTVPMLTVPCGSACEQRREPRADALGERDAGEHPLDGLLHLALPESTGCSRWKAATRSAKVRSDTNVVTELTR